MMIWILQSRRTDGLLLLLLLGLLQLGLWLCTIYRGMSIINMGGGRVSWSRHEQQQQQQEGREEKEEEEQETGAAGVGPAAAGAPYLGSACQVLLLRKRVM
jgi:hypothetical protein